MELDFLKVAFQPSIDTATGHAYWHMEKKISKTQSYYLYTAEYLQRAHCKEINSYSKQSCESKIKLNCNQMKNKNLMHFNILSI